MSEPANDNDLSSAHRRLDPFLLPTSTSVRFVLLVLLVLSTGLLSFQSLFNAFSRDEFSAFVLACGFDKTCWQQYESQQAAVMALGTLGILAAGAVLFWLMPRWKLHRDHLIPITRDDDGVLFEELHQLAAGMGLTQAPVFVWNPLDGSVGGQAFGWLGHAYVALTGGLATLHHTDRPAMRAVLLHELSHLKNRDINRTYFVLSVTPAFFALAFTPFVLSLLAEADLAVAFNVLWRGAALSLLIYLTCAAILRMREFYADWRVVLQDGVDTGIVRVIARMPQATMRVARHWLLMHPQPQARLVMLKAPQRLFHISFWEAAGAGLVIGAAVANMVAWLALALPAEQEWLSYPFVWLVLGSVLAVLLGINVWRAALAQAQFGRAWLPFLMAGLGTGCGLFAGRFLNFRPYVAPLATSTQLELAMLYVVAMIVFVMWLALSAALWMRVVRSRHSVRVVMTSMLIVAAIVMILFLGVLYFVEDNFAPLVDEPLRVFVVSLGVLERFHLQGLLIGLALASLAIPVFIPRRAGHVQPDRRDLNAID